jgi:hypothetical protein
LRKACPEGARFKGRLEQAVKGRLQQAQKEVKREASTSPEGGLKGGFNKLRRSFKGRLQQEV